MQENHLEIIRRYKSIAHLPDFLFAFTFPLRRKAVKNLNLHAGAAVLEIGCSTGANFKYLRQAVGATGHVTGVDLSPEMVVQANKRVKKMGWQNVSVMEAAAESATFENQFDGLLLFAMHDVLTSPQALDNLLKYLKPGARVVTAGPQLANHFPGTILNPLINQVYARFSFSQLDKDQPNRILAEKVKDLKVELLGPGLMYLAWGTI